MQNDDLTVHVFQNRNWCSQKSDRWFFLTWYIKRRFHRKDFKSKKKYEGTGFIFQRRVFCMQNLTKEQKQQPVVILQQAIFIYLLCAERYALQLYGISLRLFYFNLTVYT